MILIDRVYVNLNQIICNRYCTVSNKLMSTVQYLTVLTGYRFAMCVWVK